jgi:hypothetical protein
LLFCDYYELDPFLLLFELVYYYIPIITLTKASTTALDAGFGKHLIISFLPTNIL